MQGEREARLRECGYDLSKVDSPKAKYVLLKRAGGVLFSSGALPVEGDKLCSPGKVPSVVPVEEAAKMAQLCAVNILRAIIAEYGSLDRIKQVVKLSGYVNSEPFFQDQHLIVNGASDLLLHVFGEAGTHSRTSLGVAAIPLNACVEVEIIFELCDEPEHS